MKTLPHICTIEKANSGSCLPPLQANASWWQRTYRNIRKHILVSDRDPRIIEYYRTTTGLMNEKRRQVQSKYYYMIHPFSDFNNVHESVMTLVFLICFLLIPHNIAYSREYFFEVNTMNILLSVANIICMANIILKFFTGYIERKQKITILDQNMVIRHYIVGPYFAFDVISSLPTDIVGYCNPTSSVNYNLHFLRILKLTRFLTFLNCFGKTAFFARWNKTILLGVRYIMVVLMFLHWLSCLTSFVPQIRLMFQGSRHPYSWTASFTNQTTIFRYKRSLFRTAGLLLCALSDQPDDVVGFKSIDRLSLYREPTEEMMMDFITICLGKGCTAAFCVVVLCRIFEMYTLETKYQAIMNQLKEFMKNKKLPIAMRDRLVQYYEHRYQQKYFKEEVIKGILSENLRKEVNINVCKQLVHIVNIFSELPANILADVLGHLKAEVYLPNDIIIKAGTAGDCMYFLASGTVSVYTPSGREVCHLQDGAYFGEISLILKNTKRTTDIIAIEVCEVYRLDKKAFKSCFKYDKYGVFEKMQMIAEQRLQKTATLEETYKLELFQKAYTEKH